jgi:hypothetical protein
MVVSFSAIFLLEVEVIMKTKLFRWGVLSAILSLSLLPVNSAHAAPFLPGAPDVSNIGLESLGGLGAGNIPGVGDSIPGVGNVGDIISDPIGFVTGQLAKWLNGADLAWGEISGSDLLSSLPSGGNGGGLDDILGTINGTKGDMGLPDPGRSAQAASEQINADSKVDVGEVAPAHQRTVMRNAIDRELARATAQATLGQEGQTRIKESSEAAGQSVAATAKAAETAQGLDVTQDVMKQMTVQNAQMSNLLGVMYAEDLGAKVDRAYANLNLTNISQSLDQEQRARRSRMTGEAATLMRIANQSSLR